MAGQFVEPCHQFVRGQRLDPVVTDLSRIHRADSGPHAISQDRPEVVGGGEHLAAPGIHHGHHPGSPFRPGRLERPGGQDVVTGHPEDVESERLTEGLGRGHPHPQACEQAGPDVDGQSIHVGQCAPG